MMLTILSNYGTAFKWVVICINPVLTVDHRRIEARKMMYHRKLLGVKDGYSSSLPQIAATVIVIDKYNQLEHTQRRVGAQKRTILQQGDQISGSKKTKSGVSSAEFCLVKIGGNKHHLSSRAVRIVAYIHGFVSV